MKPLLCLLVQPNGSLSGNQTLVETPRHAFFSRWRLALYVVDSPLDYQGCYLDVLPDLGMGHEEIQDYTTASPEVGHAMVAWGGRRPCFDMDCLSSSLPTPHSLNGAE